MSRRRAAENLAIGMSEPHCVLLRQLPCLMCGVTPAGTVHHLKTAAARDHRGVGKRAPDAFAVPLCWLPCHVGLEQIASVHEIALFQQRGIADVHRVARDLWNETLHTPAADRFRRMSLIIVSAREGFEI